MPPPFLLLKVVSDRTLRTIDRDFGWLLETDKLNEMTFSDLQGRQGVILMINMLLHFANVGGRCGVEEPQASANYRQSVFWYANNILHAFHRTD